MNNTFTIGLYIFSSLLQADAAILGLCAVFIVYRLQSLYSQQQSYVDILQKSTISGVPQACAAMLEGDKDKIATELKKYEGNRFHPLLKFLSDMDVKVQVATIGLIPSLIIVAAHSFLSAACLWLMSFLSPCVSNLFVQAIGGVFIFLFAGVLIEVITAFQVVLDLKPYIRFFPLGQKF
jgi:hypothetical protein